MAGDDRVRPTRNTLFDDPITVTGTFLSVIAGLVSYLDDADRALAGGCAASIRLSVLPTTTRERPVRGAATVRA